MSPIVFIIFSFYYACTCWLILPEAGAHIEHDHDKSGPPPPCPPSLDQDVSGFYGPGALIAWAIILVSTLLRSELRMIRAILFRNTEKSEHKIDGELIASLAYTVVAAMDSLVRNIKSPAIVASSSRLWLGAFFLVGLPHQYRMLIDYGLDTVGRIIFIVTYSLGPFISMIVLLIGSFSHSTSKDDGYPIFFWSAIYPFIFLLVGQNVTHKINGNKCSSEIRISTPATSAKLTDLDQVEAVVMAIIQLSFPAMKKGIKTARNHRSEGIAEDAERLLP
ncbi:hypothetical protein BT63DRAFT_458180 [Microthyrium microscopicum]|uniref:Uncharacterized protein n=1 Tax=Microthyrium microscopicum TaxID=703497 RepID=A0A6A6U4Z6_9PEZI|nr:hypothetical protein BT63DRAFT_458180 [Microthyrium microscopicum]